MLKQLIKSDSVIWTMGHVGSIALHAAFQNSCHIHDLKSPRFSCEKAKAYPRVVIARLFARQVIKGKKIVTIIRNPLERNISGFFHSLHYYLSVYYADPRYKYDDIAAHESNFLATVFHRIYPHTEPIDWISDEMTYLLGERLWDSMSLVDKQCLHDSGYIVHPKAHNVMITRTEALDQAFPEIANFSKCPSASYQRRNSAQNKWYAAIRKAFQPNIETVKLYDEIYRSHPLFDMYYNER